jgi:hypothetical protein
MMGQDKSELAVLYQWSARKMQPVIIVYVAAVFAGMIVVSHFLLHSPTGVKALALASIGFIVPLVPGVLSRTEYRLTDTGLEKRPLDEKKPKEYQEVFRWDNLSHVVPVKHGFKYFLPLGATTPLRRFWKYNVSDAYSGEFHIEAKDRDEISAILASRDIPTSSK